MRDKSISELLVNNFSRGVFYSPYKSNKTKLKDLVKKLINIIFKDRYLFADYSFFWTNALEALALYRLSENDLDLRDVLINFYSKNKNKKIKKVDPVMHGYVLVKLKEKGVDDFDELIERMANFLLVDSVRSKEGIIPYRTTSHNLCFIDSLGMICPFLLGYAKEFNNKDAFDLGVKQMIHFIKKGFSENGLPYHAYDDEGKYGCIGWGRGLGWMLWGMADMFEYLDRNTAEYEIIHAEYVRLIGIVVANQKENGALSWIVDRPELSDDVSATAMCAYSIMRGIELKILGSEYIFFLQKVANFIDSCIVGGKVTQTSGECIGLGVYSDKFSYFPWGHAPSVILKNYMSGLK